MSRERSLYQVNTRAFLRDLADARGRPVTLDDISDTFLADCAQKGFEWLWFLGVWQTGEAGRQVSLHHPEWLKEFAATLPGFTEADVSGSPFAICQYTLHADFGPPEALGRLYDRVKKHGMRLLLDFVPNHGAVDHPWLQEFTDYFIQGTDADLEREPQNYFRIQTDRGPRIIAHGRDPYFPGWPDTSQYNYRHAGLRAAMMEQLEHIAGLCDGVRCDMAMLLLPDVINRTWKANSMPADGSPPVDESFWPEAVGRVKSAYPSFVFMAEVYWDLEWQLQQQGFDYTYDKRLYDRLHSRDANGVRGHLWADPDFQHKSVRFLENHDEPRAAEAFSWDVHQAAAMIAFFVPGLHFFHEGQLDGRRIKLSMHLGRRPPETPNAEIQAFYDRLLSCLRRPELREGSWQLLDCRPAWEGNPTWWFYLAYFWHGPEGQGVLGVVNFGPTAGQCYVNLPAKSWEGRSWHFVDLMGTISTARSGDDLARQGLYIDLPAWGFHLFSVDVE